MKENAIAFSGGTPHTGITISKKASPKDLSHTFENIAANVHPNHSKLLPKNNLSQKIKKSGKA